MVFNIHVFVGIVHVESVHTRISYHHTLELHHISDALLFHFNVGLSTFTRPLLDGLFNVGGVGPASSYSQEIVLLDHVFAFPARSLNAPVSITTEIVPVNADILNGVFLKQRTESPLARKLAEDHITFDNIMLV